jgi:tRNA A37 methylthiotransferase MiaB
MPTWWWSTPAASSIRPWTESLDAIGEALAENGKVIVTGCLGKREEVIRESASGRAVDQRPAGLRQRDDAVHARCRRSTIPSSTWCRRPGSS